MLRLVSNYQKWLKWSLVAFVTSIVILLLVCLLAGCEYMSAFAAGAATSETLQSWQENLEAKQAELQTAYAAAEKAIAEAPDPNALALAIKIRDALHEPMLVNDAALITLSSVMKAKAEESGSQGRMDAIGTGVLGLIGLAYREWTRKTLNKKYVASKTGQARLKIENPKAEARLYALTGEARRVVGL